MENLTTLVNTINSIVWGPPTMALILGTGLILHLLLHLIPIKKLLYACRLAWQQRGVQAEPGAISQFAALMTALGGTIGTSNIVGVATAISLGGPGTLFWMWCVSLVGMATKFAEVTLAVHFRERDSNGEYIGGPMYAIKNGLGKRWPPKLFFSAVWRPIHAIFSSTR